jgi:hypothetical protein
MNPMMPRPLLFRSLLNLLCTLLCLGLSSVWSATEPALVGRVLEIKDHLIPGPELKVIPSKGLADPLVLRITASYPHGTAGFRYDFACVPMVAGKYDLTKFLTAPTDSATAALPPLMIEAAGVLPSGPPGMLTEPPTITTPKLGGYRKLIPVGIGVWLLAGIALIYSMRKRKSAAEAALSVPPPTLAERLQPLLELACKQPLATHEKAEMERLLLAHGRERLGQTHATDPAVWRALREHPEISSWLTTLESWLHRPDTAVPTSQEFTELLTAIKKSAI